MGMAETFQRGRPDLYGTLKRCQFGIIIGSDTDRVDGLENFNGDRFALHDDILVIDEVG